jgi:hypothetical protein
MTTTPSMDAESANSTAQQTSYRREFWTQHQVNSRFGLSSAAALWKWLTSADWSEVAQWDLTAGENLYFRGQSNIDYGLTSSLYRQVRAAKPSGVITELDLRTAELALISSMRDEGLGRHLSDFELVTVLQHHLMPTRLIDVSRSPLESLYFAVESKHSVDGVLFLLNPHGASALQYGSADLPWGHFRNGRVNGDSRWTNHVAVMEHDALDPRMRAQNGTFLAGGLFRAYPGAVLTTDSGSIPKDHSSDVTNLALNFLTTRPRRVGAGWGGAGWIFSIPAAWKPELLAKLRLEGISEDTMYPAFTETARLAKHVIKQAMA